MQGVAPTTFMETGHQIELTFQSKVEYLNLVHAVTDEMARLAGFDGDASLNISLAVREAATNAVVHGNGGDASKAVLVRFGVEGNQLTVCIVDQGEGFDLEAVGDPRDAANIVRTSGRGIFLMRSFMDSVTFHPGDGKGTEVRLMKKS